MRCTRHLGRALRPDIDTVSESQYRYRYLDAGTSLLYRSAKRR